MAIWIEQTVVNGQIKSGAKPDGMCGMAPRGDNLSASELVWRDFVLNVQRHDCYTKKCFTKRGETVDDCKYGYPRRLFSDSALTALDDPACGLDIPFAFPCTNMKKNISTDRYEIRSDQPEDQRLSPYVPLWLLAWGASQGPARPPLWAIPLSKVRVIAKDTLDYTFQRYTFITLHRCIFKIHLFVWAAVYLRMKIHLFVWAGPCIFA